MNDTECPYCEAGQEINHDDGYGYDESETYKQECSDCGKVFAFNTTICFYYDTNKADCLNGGEHNFKASGSTHWPDRKYCKDCGLEERGESVWS